MRLAYKIILGPVINTLAYYSKVENTTVKFYRTGQQLHGATFEKGRNPEQII
jgi:hypothetical protein